MKRLIIEIEPKRAKQVEEVLALYEIEGMEIHNPEEEIYDDPLWEEDEAPTPPEGDLAIFKIYAEEKVFRQILEEQKDLYLQSHLEEIIEEDWNKLWAEQFPGIETTRLFIRPPWVEKKEDKVDLVIEPGMAFGTGSHETTLLCIEVLEDYLKERDVVIDVGTGSGILAILSKKLGAFNVYARELDEKALENAKVNARLNDAEIDFSHGDLLRGMEVKANLIVANILPPILVRMVEDAARLLVGEGILILSGILDKRVDELLLAYGNAFDLVEKRSQGEWVVLVLRKQ